MRTHTMTHDAAEALIRGVAPAAAPELAPLATAIADFRVAAFASPPRPSAELMARLKLAGASEISAAGVPTPGAAATASQVTTTPRSRSLGGVRRALGWFAGLGIVAKILIGASVAAAAGATGVGAVAGVGEIVTAVTSTREVPAEPDAPVTESGGGVVVPDEAAPIEPSDAVETESPAPVETDPADANPGNSGNSGNGNGNPGNGNNGNGNPGTGNSGNGNPGNNSNGNNGNNGNGNSRDK